VHCLLHANDPFPHIVHLYQVILENTKLRIPYCLQQLTHNFFKVLAAKNLKPFKALMIRQSVLSSPQSHQSSYNWPRVVLSKQPLLACTCWSREGNSSQGRRSAENWREMWQCKDSFELYWAHLTPRCTSDSQTSACNYTTTTTTTTTTLLLLLLLQLIQLQLLQLRLLLCCCKTLIIRAHRIFAKFANSLKSRN